MAAPNYTPVSLYYSTTPSAVPTNTNLINGELALNIYDKKLYAKDSTGTVFLLASETGSAGTVTNVSVVSANGFAGTVANATTAAAITLTTSVTGLLKGNGTAISAAAAGTDYAPATSGTSILSGNGSGGFSSVTVGTGLTFAGGTLAASSLGTVTSVGVSGGTTGLTTTGSPITTSGTITLGGTLSVDSGGTGVNTLTGYVKGTGTAPLSASSTIPTTDLSGTVSNAQLTNSSITINGNSVSLGGSTTITAATANPLTIGTGLTGTSYNGSAPVTVAIDSTVATLSGVQTLTNKSISGSTNTLTNIPNSALTNSALTVGSTAISLGGTATALAGLTSVTLTQDPVSDLQAATKQYVDAIATGINFHQACQLATTAALPSCTYNNGASGVGATLTATANGALSVDSTLTVVGNRVLVKNQVSGLQNGVYVVTQVGSGSLPFILTRATDYDTSGVGTNEIDAGDLLLILGGTTLANTSWVQQTVLPITVGTTALVFVQFAAPLVYTAGTGLNESPPYQFNIANTGVTAAAYGSAAQTLTATVNSQGQLTVLAATNIAINGNQITSGTVGSPYISGSYTNITGVGTLTAGTWNANTIGVAYGGTGQTTYTDGQLLIGNSSGNTLTKSTLTAGSGISITNGGGSITIASTGGGVTSFSAGTTGFTPNTATSGAVTLAGTLNLANGGTGATTVSGAQTNLQVDPAGTAVALAIALG